MRVIDFADGFTSSAPPAVGFIGKVTGSRAAPLEITSGAGISVSDFGIEKQYVVGSGGPVDIAASPQIAPGTYDGQILILVGRDDARPVVIENGNGVSLDGACSLGEDDTLVLNWDGTNWSEEGRRR